MRNRTAPAKINAAPLQLDMALDSAMTQTLSNVERARVVASLANLLLLAAGVTPKENDDEDDR